MITLFHFVLDTLYYESWKMKLMCDVIGTNPIYVSVIFLKLDQVQDYIIYDWRILSKNLRIDGV